MAWLSAWDTWERDNNNSVSVPGSQCPACGPSYRCNLCEFTFSLWGCNESTHRRKAQQIRTWTTKQCSVNDRQYNEALFVLLSLDPQSKKLHICAQCNIHFSPSGDLKTHTRDSINSVSGAGSAPRPFLCLTQTRPKGISFTHHPTHHLGHST